MYIDFDLRCPKVCNFFRLNESLDFKQIVKNKLSQKRFEHCLAVAEMLYELDMNIGKNTSLVLGLAHDFTKEISDAQTNEIIWKNKLPLYEGEAQNRQVLHAVTAGFLFRKIFPDAPLLFSFAIRHHTILSFQYFSDICFNLFVADKIDYTRKYISQTFREEILKEKNPEIRVLKVLKMQEDFFKETQQKFLSCTEKLFETLKEKYESK